MAITFLDEEEDIVATAEPQKGKSRITFLDEGTPVEAPVSERSKITFLDEEPAVTARPEQPAPPVGTSLMAELAALPQALQQGIEQPTEAMGETATALGMPALGKTLRGAVEAPKDYVPAAQRFMEPQEGEFQIAGFAPQYLPRAAVEQAPQVIGTVLSGIGGRAIGGVLGLPLGPKGVVAGQVAGQFLGPALFEMGQIVGPVARERAANQGREEPNTDDLAWAWGTAGASGALNAIGAKYLPFGDDIASGLAKSVSKAFAGEFTTEGAQAVVQQAGETFLTERGLDIKPKQALGEAIIGGVAGGGAAAAAAPFTPAVKAAAAAETKVVAEQAAPVAPETAQIVSEQANQVIAQAQAEETAETPDERVARLQREAQEAAGEIELEEEGAGLPPQPVTPTPEATPVEPVAPVEPVFPAEGAVEPTAAAAPTELVAPTEPTVAEPTPAVAPRPAIDVETLSPNAKRANRILTNTGVDPETAAFVVQQYQDEIADLGGEELRAFILDKFEENGGVIPAQMRYSEDQEYYEMAFGIGPEEAATLVENAKAQNAQMAQNELEQNKQWRRKDEQVTEAQQGVAVAQPEAQAVPLPAGEVPPSPAIEGRGVPLAAPEAAVTPAIPQLEPLRRVARAEQTEEDVAGLVDAGFVEVYNGQPVITQAGLDALPEAERPRLTPEARKIQIDTRTSEAAAEAISKNLRIGVDQVPVDVRMPSGWTLVGDVYVPPQPQAVAPAPEAATAEAKFSQFVQPKERPDLAEFPDFKSFEMNVRGVPVRFDIDTTKSDENTLYLESFRVPRGERRQGIGREAMTNVLRWADENNVTLKGEALTAPADRQYRTPQEMREQGYMTPRELFRFYQSLGWESDPEGPSKTMGIPMVYRPKPEAEVAPTPEVREARKEPAITPQQDRDYLDAVERGDYKTAQRILDSGFPPLPEMSQGLKEEISYWLNASNESGNVMPSWLALKDLMGNWGDRDSVASSFKKELQDIGIKLGYYQTISLEDAKLRASQGLNLGKGYDFKRGDKYYIGDGETPLNIQPTETRDEGGNIIPPSQRFAPPSMRGMESEPVTAGPVITSQQDADYLAAVERGDMEAAQRMVDNAAKAAGYGVRGFHGTDARFTVFDSRFRNKTPFAFDDHGLGFFFSNNKSFVEKFGDIQMPVYLKMGDSYEITYDEYIKELKDLGQRAGESIRKDLKRDGYQSINIIGYNPATTIQAVFDPEQIKSAETVVRDDQGNIIPLSQRFQPEQADIRYRRRVKMGRAGMEQAAVEARLQELGFPTGGIIRVVNEPDADFEGRTIILDGKVTGIELNAAAMRDNATIDRVLNHEFAESANADGALNRLVERLTPKEKKEINDTITRLRYEERARTSEEAARAIETLAEAWKGRGFFTRAVARVEAWASKLGFKLTRRAAEYIAARNLADINAGFRTAYNRFINVKGEAREGRAFITPEENARFLELAKDPEANREELQKMVDSAAKRAGYNIRLFRGGVQDYNVFRTEKTPEGAAFFTDSPAVAQQFATERGARGRVKQFFIKASNPKTINFELIMEQIGPNEWVHSVEKMRFQIRSAKIEGYDSLIIKNVPEDAGISTQYAIFNPEQIKSIDVIARDNQGNVIPLNERFQPTTPDIRYALKQKPVDFVFSPEAFRRVGEGFKSRSKIIRMSIDDFLKLATQLPREQSQEAQNAFDAGIKWDSIPNFETRTDENGIAKIIGHEGRHRALVLKRAGYTEMPVAIIDRAIRWAEQTDPQSYDYVENFPTQLEAERTKERIPFPFSREDGTVKYVPQTAEIRESRREPEAIPTFTEGTPEAATLKEMAASMAKVDSASEAKGGKPETYKISEIASVWMDSGLGERELQDAIVEYTNLTPANAARVAKAIAKQYGIQQQLVEAAAPLAEIAPEPEGAPRKSAVTKLIEQTTGVRKPVVKLQVSESAALKKQIQLKAREARETRKARKEAAEDLAKSITDYVKANPIRGPINSRQAMSITKKALKLDVNNEAAVDRFEMYVERVIENANYDRDLADARALIKRAKAFAKSKDTQGNVKTTLEAIANISPTLLDNPFEFNLVVQRYLLGLAPVTAKQYAVMPDADVRRYLESLETQIKDNQEVLDRSKAQRILDKQAAYAEEKGIPLDEAIAILNSEEFLQEKTIEKLEDLTKLLTSMAQESQKDVKAYDDSGATPKQKELISFMRKVNLDSLINEEKKRYIRFANNLLANGATFGMEQFQSIALGQEAAMKAAKDRRLSNKLSAWISPIGGDKAIDTARRIAAKTQSEADTFKNIFGREAVGAFRNILGLNRLDVAQTDSNRAKEQIANEFGEYFKGLRKKYGDDATNFEAKGYAGIAGYLIQTDGNKTEAESIPYRRRLMEQNIVKLRKSDKQADLAEADLKERALAQLTGTTNAEILSQLRALNPASYEQLMWVKDVMLPKWRDFLKEHDENFRNQANNYNNPDHLTITYKFPEGQLLPSEMEDVYQQDMIGMRIKQAANSIKRKDHPNLPVSKAGTIANIDINFGYNQYNALVDQVDKAFVAPAWEQVVAFTKAPEFEQVMGGRANALFVKNLLRDIQTSRSRQSLTDDEAQLIAGGVRLARKISTQAVLGGITQPLRQVPDQLAKLFFTTGRFDLITKNLLTTAQAAPLLNKFPIGRRGDAQAGTQYASQFSELARKVEASVTDRKWAKYRELMNKVGEFWMTPLRGSDVWAAKVSWMSYYEAELNKKGIKMESWEREAELVDTDQDRKEAASYAEFAVDFYGGASDPTKMASLSKQTNNGWKEFAKLVFLPLNSFALQQKNSLISDLRDVYLRTGDRKASIAAIAGTLAGMAAFHGMRIYIIGGLIYPAGKALLMGIFGIDMDEPDEEEKQKQLEDNWRKFKASMYGNIIAGGAGEFAEKAAIDAVNRTAYLWDANINPDSLLNEKGEIMSFRQYEKEVSPLYRFRSYGSSEYSFGLADVLTEQATHALAETQQLMTPEEMEKYTGNEQAYAAFATAIEWMYFFRLMDTDVKRIATDLKRQMDKGVEEREKELKRIREGR